ncbi:hypothetical protein CP061683_0464A, partial [Chlamydia psittaci 06-1683]
MVGIKNELLVFFDCYRSYTINRSIS